jgi:malonyl-CoA/methylmalonyl-CoA synthetase
MPEKNAEEFTDDGFFRTGDMGCISADEYVTIVGRSKDLIITGGYNVYPKEIELAIGEIEGVQESAVIGIPHADFGEAVVAAVVRKPGSPGPAEKEVIAALKARLANFKVPKHVYFVEELPRNAMGKVQKNVLRDRFTPRRREAMTRVVIGRSSMPRAAWCARPRERRAARLAASCAR